MHGIASLVCIRTSHYNEDYSGEAMCQLQRESNEAAHDAWDWSYINLDHVFHEVGYPPANDKETLGDCPH